LEENGKHAVLALEDGTILYGRGFGAETQVTGEVVFNTSMFGYPELLTDPSYYDQIVVMTYPIIGSYGVPKHSIQDKHGLPLHFESDSIKVKGYAVHTLSSPSHWASEMPLNEWLEKEHVPGIQGIDTRSITKKLRVNGTMLGFLKVSSSEPDRDQIKREISRLEDPNQLDLVGRVTASEPVSYESGPSAPVVVLVDCGTKYGILRNLLGMGATVIRVPYNYSADKILDYEPSGVVISNGPGDPSKCTNTINSTKGLMETDLPIMGICLGTQILALAAGAETYKLKFGHRAVNHPCLDLKSGRCFITTQNHGYAIKSGSLDGTGLEPSHLNANDKTIEGIRHRSGRVFGVQWHPESAPGPYDTRFLFDEFMQGVTRR